MFRKNKKGSAALPVVLALGSLLVFLSLLVSSLAFFELSTQSSLRNSLAAFVASEAGLEDAALRLARNKNFSSSGYQLVLEQGSVIIEVKQDEPGPGQVLDQASGSAKKNFRKVKYIFDLSPYGKLTNWLWQEE